ncbi:UDP-N-acetylmuramate dehydrogenase [Hazenella sp. IB182357]|uniref:UDP-N-acetylenolpyruvoylglucosamine reductase n=1 Tax=Polycladospora coralii TaxID=2771432 RepID=A0A926RT70_9BACL|nr:UDP-N-acetylmuramate dehydrogenase [Polycladospora coralii]MBD1371323.1 UDP-N-acetylmuramate dehydrogenase [Polycladospora coralii]
MLNIADALQKADVNHVRMNEPMSRHTTWKVGGPADLLIYPQSKKELSNAMRVVNQFQLPWRAIGRGSNLLVRDGGIRGVVFKLDEGFNHFHVEGSKVVVGGGYSTILCASMVSKQGLTGLEFAGGIPGNIGGAVYMNAGAHGSDISRVLTSAEVLLENGEWKILSNEALCFKYRTSILQNELRGIVTEATFELEWGDPELITASLQKFKDRRRQTQPLQFPCAGSVFRNPEGDYAGRLIQAAGLSGFRVGDAEVSTLHANFIINRGQAIASDVLNLISHVISVIETKFGVTLKPEVQVIGEE